TTGLVIGPNQTVQGAGQIGLGKTTITNNGTIIANQSAGLTLSPSSGGFTTNGVLQVDAGNTLIVTGGPLNNFNPATNTLTGGTYNVFAAGTLRVDHANIVNNAATILLDGANSRILNNNTSADALTGLAKNETSGSFTIQNGRN